MRKVLPLIILSFVFSLFPLKGEISSKTLVFGMNTDGSKHYRIPALVVAADGTLIAISDKRDDIINDMPNTISAIAKEVQIMDKPGRKQS